MKQDTWKECQGECGGQAGRHLWKPCSSPFSEAFWLCSLSLPQASKGEQGEKEEPLRVEGLLVVPLFLCQGLARVLSP